MNEEIKTVYVKLVELIDALDMRGKNGVYLHCSSAELFALAKNYKFEVNFSRGQLNIFISENKEEK